MNDPHDQGWRADAPRLLAQLQAAAAARTAASTATTTTEQTAATHRRQALRLLGGLGLAGSLPLLGCGGGGDAAAGSPALSTSGGTTSTTTTTTTATGSCSAIPGETAGPYPGDGSNTANGSVANVLTLADIVRRDIRSSIGGLSGTAGGVPLSVTLTLVNSAASCAVLPGYAVYLWHCSREGLYSMYSAGVTQQNYLRGVQGSDANGQVTFQTVFPGCYSGRWPHIHFEVFRSLAATTSGANDILTSQLALPKAQCQQVYAGASGYSASVADLAAVSLTSDGVFGDDGAALQLATLVGDLDNGFTAQLTVAVAG